ncbi:flagellar basal-body MS-ring/collar protein FliF [Nitratiruptor tergarcus]|uniref:Flagellar M-ring protein n=1 Tax=Nitratiruptor tergarcus DSM 16512 TaxID=1069081 RepID=A0A1W1WTA9_9BACT|nr:flagellar basal-body MS-ring/collar protein FliF [Nitratiruptor tergarcus]SMC09290.1 flagellar M-ring protein FliF [Nitratiruptor tergarcus DSM 16512]
MALDFTTLQTKAKELFENQNFLKTLFLALSVIAIIILLSALLFRDISKERYGVLYTNLSPDDAGKILSELQQENIPYEVKGDGSIILVPKDKIYDIRLKLAAKGIPSSHDVGFEIFNEPKMGATHFQENINYIRAIEGELARTIKKIDAIKEAKVNIALPQDSIFAREEDEAKASVIVSLWPGKDLSKEQVKAIIFLVSHAVAKLKPQNVTVVDNQGRVLSDLVANEKQDEPSDIVNIKRKIKREIEKSIQSMLARALGAQKVVVRASVDVETSKVNKKDEIYDPDKVAIVSERKIQEKTKGFEKQKVGAPGTPTNVPATINRKNNNLLLDKNKKDVTTNYDVTKSYIVTKKNVFKVKKISVGVLVDGKYIKKIDKNGTVTVEYVPRSKEELAAYERLIKSAIGFDEQRGDKVTVVSVPFETTKPAESVAAPQEKTMQIYLLIGAIVLMVLILFGLVATLLMKRRRAKLQELEAKQVEALQGAGAQAAEAAAALHAKEEDIFNFEKEPLYTRILEVAEENPDILADMISKWIKEESK